MKLTLRKANAIQSVINDELKSLDLDTSITLNEFEGLTDQIGTARDNFFKNAAKRTNFTVALYEIRSEVAKANASVGINDMLSSVAYFEKQIGHYTRLASRGPQTALRVLLGQIKKIADIKEDGYGHGRRDTITSIFTEEEIEQFIKNVSNFKREKQKLKDQLLELNIRTEIELSKGTAEFLVNAGIL